jgi:phosphoribosylamine--glycine ligase
MGKLRVGVVSYGSRGATLADAFARSVYKPQVYIVSKQENPMNKSIAKGTGGEHIVLDLSDVDSISSFFKDHNVKFVFPGPEKPIIAGLANKLKEYGIFALCPTQEYALEASKVKQRMLLEEVYPDANPRYMVFERGVCTESEVRGWLAELKHKVAIKPDLSDFGKGVGVSEDHFEPTSQGCYQFFLESMKGMEDGQKLIIEERVEGEESSLQALCDGKDIVALPDVRDYKRAFDGDKGPNTGGMGSYMDVVERLPFMTEKDRLAEEKITQGLFDHLKKGKRDEGLLGVPFYMAFIHTKEGPKVLEINSRFGDPEGINMIPVFGGDFVNICNDMINGELSAGSLDLYRKASVVVHLVPPTYGGKEAEYIGNKQVAIRNAIIKMRDAPDKYRVYPGDMALDDDNTCAIKSRTVACVGIGYTIEEARNRAYELVYEIRGGNLWWRTDIASKEHIQASVDHMKKLRTA